MSDMKRLLELLNEDTSVQEGTAQQFGQAVRMAGYTGKELEKDPAYKKSVQHTRQEIDQSRKNQERVKAGYGEEPDEYSDLEEASRFSFANPKQKPGDQVRGKETAKAGKQHPFKNRLVGEQNMMQELESVLKDDTVKSKRDLFREYQEFSEALPAKALQQLYKLKNQMVSTQDPHPEEEPQVQPVVQPDENDSVKELGELKRRLAQVDTLIKFKTGIEKLKSRAEKLPGGIERGLASDLELEDLYPIPSNDQEYEKVLEKYKKDFQALQSYIMRKKAVYKRNESTEFTEDGAPNTVTVDIPLMIRLFEYAREDAKSDMDLHFVAEKMISLSEKGRTLSMDDYNAIVGKTTEAIDPPSSQGVQNKTNTTDPVNAQSKSPEDIAKEKADQQNLIKNISQLKSAGIDINPNQAQKAFTKADTGVALNPTDKETVSKLAPAVGDIIANPNLAGQFKALVQKAQQQNALSQKQQQG